MTGVYTIDIGTSRRLAFSLRGDLKRLESRLANTHEVKLELGYDKYGSFDSCATVSVVGKYYDRVLDAKANVEALLDGITLDCRRIADRIGDGVGFPDLPYHQLFSRMDSFLGRTILLRPPMYKSGIFDALLNKNGQELHSILNKVEGGFSIDVNPSLRELYFYGRRAQRDQLIINTVHVWDYIKLLRDIMTGPSHIVFFKLAANFVGLHFNPL
uniref:Uncharacterized protein n=1 Tax=Parascaris equorum TaxID=6256 RepID=A0A914RMM9_PAREQ